MNIIRGMDRIALVLAIIAILPGFVLGVNITNEALKSVTTEYKAEYKAWEKKFGDVLRDLEKKDREWEKQQSSTYFKSIPPWEWRREQGLEPPGPPRQRYNYPPAWQCIMGGIASAPLSFLVVLYSLRGMTRGTRWFALWIIEGFRDGNKEEPDKHTEQ